VRVESRRCRRRPSGGVAGIRERSSRIEMDVYCVVCTKTKKTSSCRVIATGVLLELFKAVLHLSLFPHLSQHVFTRNETNAQRRLKTDERIMDRKAFVLANA